MPLVTIPKRYLVSQDEERKHKIKLPDAVIAATAICQEAVLVTRNVHDFQGIAEFKLENPFSDE